MKQYSLLLEGKAIRCVSTVSDPAWTPVSFDGSAAELATEYAFDNGLRHIGPQPTGYHIVSPETGEWTVDLPLAFGDLTKKVASELEARIYLPCNGFDADRTSRERISGMIARLQRGDGLPAGWMGWRDAENNMHWITDDAAAVLTNLTALSRAIEDREQALLVASWTHKANIAALTDIDAIIGYDVTASWPV